jgi:long-chain acyl-CoA synthetase
LIFLLTEPEIRHVLADSGAAGIVTLAEHVEKVRAAALSLPDPPCVVMADDLGPLRS